jgi:FRG domain
MRFNVGNLPSRFTSNVEVCSGWEAVTKAFDELPKPVLRRDDNGETYQERWVYRGHKTESYRLEPSIEREYPFHEWAEVEYRSLREFQARAPMHMQPPQLPPAECRLRWLALMQHYGAPTRLLDFTYSPYVALYFALRHRNDGGGRYAEVWGVDAVAVQRKAEQIIWAADKEVRKQQGLPEEKPGPVGIRLEDMVSALQRAEEEDNWQDTAMRNVLTPCGVRREYFNRKGLIAVAMPPVQNVRLSSQQGVFLFNGAENLSFEESLEVMMRGSDHRWYKRFQIPEQELHRIEEHLFQMNIHELSLFPDSEGLAGFVRQRMRLHW